MYNRSPERLSSCKTETPHPLNNSNSFLPLPPPATTVLLSLWFWHDGCLREVNSYFTYIMSSGFLYIAACVRILLLFKAKYYSMVYTPRCVYTACSRSILLSLDVGVTSTFRILSVILLWTGVRNIFSKSSSPLEGRRLLGSDGNSSFNFLKALHTVPQQLSHFIFPWTVHKGPNFCTSLATPDCLFQLHGLDMRLISHHQCWFIAADMSTSFFVYPSVLDPKLSFWLSVPAPWRVPSIFRDSDCLYSPSFSVVCWARHLVLLTCPFGWWKSAVGLIVVALRAAFALVLLSDLLFGFGGL